MGFLTHKHKAFILASLLVPFLMANKDCQRPTTWGNGKTLSVNDLKVGHPEIDLKTNCKECHEDPSVLKPASHDAAWTRLHGSYAEITSGYRRSGNVCSVCHNESWCTKCHQEQPPRDHNNYWRMKGHGVAVGLNRSRCMSCHTADTCDKCHSTTTPATHTASWGSTRNNHCLNCHLPLSGASSEQCSVCHDSTTSHDAAPAQPNNGFHVAGATCRSCHEPLTQHADNGDDCQSCHL